jgi:hypothetical protein
MMIMPFPGLHGIGPHRLPFQLSLPDDCPVLHLCRFISLRPPPQTVIKTIRLCFMSRPLSPPEASSNPYFHALRILRLPAQALVASVPNNSSLCDPLHRRQPKEFKMPLIQHRRPLLQFQGSRRCPPLDYKMASLMRLLHTPPLPITICHPPWLIHRKQFHAKPPPATITAEPPTRTTLASNRCWLVPPRPPLRLH